jgi:hypothetical protein
MPQTDSPLARMIQARANLVKDSLRGDRARPHLIPVITKLDAAIRALSEQKPRTRPRSAPAFRSGALARPAWSRRQRVARLLQIDEDEMRLALPPHLRH